MHVSAKADYAVRAVIALAATYPEKQTTQELAERHAMPRKFLEAVLADLRRASVISSTRGPDGGYSLRREPEAITLGEILRVIDGPLADVHGLRPDEVAYPEGLQHLQEVWVAARSAVRSVFDEVTLDQLVTGEFAPEVSRLFASESAWEPRTGPQRPTLGRGAQPEFNI
jgi:Rrf2 family protein